MDDSKLRYFASAWLISITLPADSAERYNAQVVNGIDPLDFNHFVASDGYVMPGTSEHVFYTYCTPSTKLRVINSGCAAP
ncbi:hypothetical protein, partial [Klebsiella pneumoniae]|uniref:hypothetical protein n=1 Tax=Klebsiella pneumoniae TaxID=573 RepID=UPI003F61CA7E